MPKNKGDIIVNSYREADHQIDKMIDAMNDFKGEPEFHKAYKETVEWAIIHSKRASYYLNNIISFIVELEGSGYGD